SSLIWDAKTKQVSARFRDHASVVFSTAWDRDSRRVAFAGATGDQFTLKVKALDATSEQDGVALSAESEFFAAAFSLDGKYLVTGGREYTVKIWDVETRELLHTLRGHNGDVYTVAFSPDGRWVASAGEDSTVKVWDGRTGDLLRNFRGHTGLVSTLAFLDGRT